MRALRGCPAVLVLVCCCRLALAAGPVESRNSPRADQFGGRQIAPSIEDLYQQQAVGDVFRKEAYREPEFLPPEAWNPPAPAESEFEMTQYPYADTVPRDGEPELLPRMSPSGPQVQPGVAAERGWHWLESTFATTVIPGPGDDFGWTSFDFVSRGSFHQAPWLQFLPRFSFHLLDGPSVTDLPPRLYDFALDTLVFIPVSDRWSFLGMAGPAMFSDFETDKDGFRITGRALAFYQWSPTVKLSGGFLYLDRDDVTALPAGGITYTPNEAFKAEILFPKPKIAWRFHCDEDDAHWLYVAGEFGGNSWAIRRASGADDVVSIRDLRLLVGLEAVGLKSSRTDGMRQMIEAGFVFSRRLEYRSGIGDTDQDPTGLLRYVLVR